MNICRCRCWCAALRAQVAYVPQTAWILNATLRDNILFGRPYDAERYFAAVRAAELERDVEILPGGHDTEMCVPPPPSDRPRAAPRAQDAVSRKDQGSPTIQIDPKTLAGVNRYVR